MPVHITTERLLLRNFVSDDWKDLLEIAIDKAASPLAIYDHQFPTSEHEVKRITNWFVNGTDFLAVCESSTNRVIGYIYLGGETEKERDLGYNFHSKYWGKGYATEACVAAIEHAFNSLGVERITSSTANLNSPSVKLLRSLGFHKTGESLGSFTTTPEGSPIEFMGSSYLLEKVEWEKRH